MGPDNMVRLYVGGLPGDVSPEQVAQRFQPFGTVSAVELVPEKAASTAEPRPRLKACRGFAYVQLAPRDAAALHRCISMYNGCKWLGGVLRVEVAKPDFRARFAAEEQAERHGQQQHAEAHAAQLAGAVAPATGSNKASGTPAAPPLRILRRDGTKTMKVEPNQARTYFPPVRQRAAKELSWDRLTPPPAFVRWERIHNAACPAQQPRVSASAAVQATAGPAAKLGQDGRAGAVAKQEMAGDARQGRGTAPARQQDAQKAPAAEDQNAPEGESESDVSEGELEAVDFFSPEEAASLVPAPALADCRFDSSSDDEGDDNDSVDEDNAGQPVKEQAAALEGRQAAVGQDRVPGARQEGVHLQLESAPAPQQRSEAQVDQIERASRGLDAGRGSASELAAGTSSKEDKPVLAAEDDQACGHADEQGSDNTTQENSEQSQGISAPGLSVAPSSSGAEESNEEETTSEQRQRGGSGPEGLHMQSTHDGGVPDVATSSRDVGQPEQALGPHGARHESGHEEAASGSGGDEEPEQAPNPDQQERLLPDGAAVSSMPPSSLHDVEPLEEAEAQLLAGLAVALPKGAAFCRRAGDDKVEAAWQAARESMVADYKSKRRMALRQNSAQRKRPHH